MNTAADKSGAILEVSESVWPADRIVILDDYDIAQEPERSKAYPTSSGGNHDDISGASARDHCPEPLVVAAGWRTGRHFYACHLTLDDQPQLRELVGRYQDAFRHLPNLDLIPPQWLHITTQGIGFADEISPADLATATQRYKNGCVTSNHRPPRSTGRQSGRRQCS